MNRAMSSAMNTPHDLSKTSAVFLPNKRVNLKQVTDSFYQELDHEYGDFKDHILVSEFSFDENWSTWEVHPAGDEIVMLIAGDADLVMALEAGETSVTRLSQVGEFVVVPKGVWHTARPHAATTMLFLTPGEGTLNATEPGGDAL